MQKKQKEASPGDGEAQTLTSDEMSIFYKKFLDENWLVHVKYNKEWYKKNLGLLLLSFRVQLLKSFQMLQKKKGKH